MRTLRELLNDGWKDVGHYGFAIIILQKGDEHIIYDIVCDRVVRRYKI